MTETCFQRRDITPCAVCGHGIMHNNPTGIFWRVWAERLMVDRAAVGRAAGLEQMFGGNAALADVFSPERSFANQIQPAASMLICEPCVIGRCGSLAGAIMPETHHD